MLALVFGLAVTLTVHSLTSELTEHWNRADAAYLADRESDMARWVIPELELRMAEQPSADAAHAVDALRKKYPEGDWLTADGEECPSDGDGLGDNESCWTLLRAERDPVPRSVDTTVEDVTVSILLAVGCSPERPPSSGCKQTGLVDRRWRPRTLLHYGLVYETDLPPPSVFSAAPPAAAGEPPIEPAWITEKWANPADPADWQGCDPVEDYTCEPAAGKTAARAVLVRGDVMPPVRTNLPHVLVCLPPGVADQLRFVDGWHRDSSDGVWRGTATGRVEVLQPGGVDGPAEEGVLLQRPGGECGDEVRVAPRPEAGAPPPGTAEGQGWVSTRPLAPVAAVGAECPTRSNDPPAEATKEAHAAWPGLEWMRTGIDEARQLQPPEPPSEPDEDGTENGDAESPEDGTENGDSGTPEDGSDTPEGSQSNGDGSNTQNGGAGADQPNTASDDGTGGAEGEPPVPQRSPASDHVLDLTELADGEVVWYPGSIRIHGKLGHDVSATVIASEDIVVLNMFPGAQPEEVLALAAGCDMRLQRADGDNMDQAPDCADPGRLCSGHTVWMTNTAVVLPAGGIWAPQWHTPRIPPADWDLPDGCDPADPCRYRHGAPTFAFYGSAYTRYRGVLGGSDNNGVLSSGWHKRWQRPAAFHERQPPWWPHLAGGVWEPLNA